MKTKKMRRLLALGLAFALTASSLVPATETSAASQKKVKSVTLKIGKKEVTKKTYKLTKGKTAKITVTVNPAKAKKEVTFKSLKQKVATVSKAGKVKAKKVGTAKIKVTVTGKDKKKKTTWVKVKVAADTPAPTDTSAPSGTEKPVPTGTAKPAKKVTYSNTIAPKAAVQEEFTLKSNPIVLKDGDGNPIYGGDPNILVDGDTAYLYVGHDVTASGNAYQIPEYLCYSSKDLKTWKYYGSVLSMEDVAWTNDNTSAWAAQVMRHEDKYYMYFCSWDKTSSGKQSIGVAVADNPTGPFVDIGEPLVKGTFTTDETSGWNDIDPTAWIEVDENGVEHRYLMWGNGKLFVCELNEDMISVKDVNGDGKITFGTQASGRTSGTVDVIEKQLTFTEAPWIYRRQDDNGNYIGDYYIFYAWGFNEQMAYSTVNDLMDGKIGETKLIMDPTATSDTNHMAVFDFNGKTYFIYHNGMTQGGFGQRRTPSITELKFNSDGSVQPMLETVSGNGFFDTELSKLYSATGDRIYHEKYTNSSDMNIFPYLDVKLGVFKEDEVDDIDGQWVFCEALATITDTENEYVSIQSENKPGLYITANSDGTATLAHPADVSEENAKLQTFKVVPGLADSNGVSYESVSQPGKYLTNLGGTLYITGGTRKVACTFYKDNLPSTLPTDSSAGSTNSIQKIEAGEDSASSVISANADGSYTLDGISRSAKSFCIKLTLEDPNGYATINGALAESDTTVTIELPSGESNDYTIKLYAENSSLVDTIVFTVKKDYSKLNYDLTKYTVLQAFDFENETDGAVAVTKGLSTPIVQNPTYSYTDGVNGGTAISLSGDYGLKLSSDISSLGDTYTVSYWMKPNALNGGVDPTFCAGTFSPEKWINLTFTRPIWANNGGYLDSTPGEVSGLYTANEWQHVALVVNNGSGTLYVNGEEKGTISGLAGIMTNSGAAAFFGVNGWDAYFNGSIDEIMFFNGALTEDDVIALAANLESCKTLKQ